MKIPLSPLSAGTSGQRHTYHFTDTTAKSDVVYYYRIEEVSLSGDRQQLLLAEGVFAPAIRPPAVPTGTSRLRLTVMATHTETEMQKAVDAFAEVKDL